MRLEHELTPIVTKWLKGTKRSPYTAQQSVSKVMKDLSQTPQRRRRRWSLAWRTSSRTDSPEVAHRDLHPAPIQATNGHAPTVIGRTQTMFSPVKAITAGALVFALGGVLLIAQPFDQQGNVPGATTDASVSVVQGQYDWVGEGPTENLPLEGMLERSRVTEFGRLSMSDERLSGDVTLGYNIDRWATDEVEAIEWATGDVALFWGTVLIENDGGTWEGTHFSSGGQAQDRPLVSPLMQLTGTGDYEGLSAILYGTTDPLVEESPERLDGMIFPGELPPAR